MCLHCRPRCYCFVEVSQSRGVRATSGGENVTWSRRCRRHPVAKNMFLLCFTMPCGGSVNCHPPPSHAFQAGTETVLGFIRLERASERAAAKTSCYHCEVARKKAPLDIGDAPRCCGRKREGAIMSGSRAELAKILYPARIPRFGSLQP